MTAALHDWYGQEQKEYEIWAKRYPISSNSIGATQIEKQKQWCKAINVSVTPTMLINGYKLPDQYQLIDLKYML